MYQLTYPMLAFGLSVSLTRSPWKLPLAANVVPVFLPVPYSLNVDFNTGQFSELL